nr:S9 family peptidase [Ornithinimicrobium sp. F0845]
MSWHETTLWLGDLDEHGDLHRAHTVAGGSGESLEQPLWLDDATLLVLSDRTGWSNLHRLDVSSPGGGLQAVTTEQLDLGLPRWVPDTSTYALLPGGRVVSGRSREGFRELVVIDPATGATEVLDSATTAVTEIAVLADGTLAVEAARADLPTTVVTVDPRTAATAPVVPEEPSGLEDYAATPEPVSWPGADGETAHGFLYLPRNPQVRAPERDLPPLVVTLHGGPTAAAVPGHSAARTFWTSRGFAVLDVNYGGSTGYGRAYRERLDGRWGEVDVQDAATGARHLAEQGLVDGARLLITGGSAGGFTTLAAATFTDVFAAGASHFGISDLATLATDTHKLESRYCDGLVAPWPEGREVYAARSPIHHVDRLATPLILLQGTDDQVVPRAQAEQLAEVLRTKGLPVALVLFEGEGHGFRALDNQVRALESELSFYAQVLGLDPPEGLDPVPVENLSSARNPNAPHGVSLR